MAGNLDSWMLLDSVSNAATSQEFYKMLQSSIASTPFDTVMNVNSKMGSDGVRAAVADYTNRFLLRANVRQNDVGDALTAIIVCPAGY